MPREFRTPSLGKRVGRTWSLPAKPRRHHPGTIVSGKVAAILGQDLEEAGREEVTVTI